MGDPEGKCRLTYREATLTLSSQEGGKEIEKNAPPSKNPEIRNPNITGWILQRTD